MQYFDELIIQGFDFINGFNCNNVHKFEKVNILSINKIELSFCQDQSKRKQNLLPIENIKNISDRVVDLLIYKNSFVLIKYLHPIWRVIVVIMFVEDV